MKWAAAAELEMRSSYDRVYGTNGRELGRSAASFEQYRQMAMSSAPVNVPFNRVDPVVFPAIAASEQVIPSVQTFSGTGPSGCDASNPAVTSRESPGSIGKSNPVSMKMIAGMPNIPTATIKSDGSFR